jgi:hypothetical protein
VGPAPDHNSAEWSLWIGRPLLGQWAFDVVRLLDVLDHQGDGVPVLNSPLARRRRPQRIIVGDGPAGLVALTTAALVDQGRIDGVIAVNTLASFVTDVPYEGQRLGTLAPGILRDVGDVPHLAALALPHRVMIVGGTNGGDKSLPIAELEHAYAVTRSADQSRMGRSLLRIENELPAKIADALQ